MDSFKKEHHLQSKLNEYHVDIPDFPMKSNKWIRFISFLASPTKDPFESIISTSGGIMSLKIVPLIGTAAIALLQVFILL
ncbi:hypothetical protein [Bacillus suaedaesalsae]|uniref:Uncharacterized protein n=1 Tax=Bacillus suaedaesalsae TaxID=2810349 RepID=A0ABS2DKF2_9BACI|nr:hypothetical protein [Bacillus suaedaesalsae]MBM6617996.1 hypothetical protein [Bacillus suaedaesalsae]